MHQCKDKKAKSLAAGGGTLRKPNQRHGARIVTNRRMKRPRSKMASQDPSVPGSSGSPSAKKRKTSMSSSPTLMTTSKKTTTANGGPSGVAMEIDGPDDDNSLASSLSAYDLSSSNNPQQGTNTTPGGRVAGRSATDHSPDEEEEEEDNSCSEDADNLVANEDQAGSTSGTCSPEKRRSVKKASVMEQCDEDLDNSELLRRYPLRSRIRLEELRHKRDQMSNMPKDFAQFPPEVYSRIFHYLSVQDIFRIQRVNRRFSENVITYLQLVKRINFSSGLPFAFLPESMDDKTLRRILSRTPQVTHILGFYPRRIYDSQSLAQANGVTSGVLTYAGVMSCFRACAKLRSVEIMDVELMTRVVNSLPRVKFHGMFRNRPDSWDAEFAAQTPPSRSTISGSSSTSCSIGVTGSDRTGVGYPGIGSGGNPVTVSNHVLPIPRLMERLVLPNSVNNLTKLDLVSVCVTAMPRLENIKYLHLKWVRFSNGDPFQHMVTPKLQSFVMNNCVGPTRALRYIRIFTSLARAPQLSRVEIVSTRFVEGLMEHIIEDGVMGNAGRSFRSLQRLVMAGNRDCGEGDLGFVLLAAQSSLAHLALQFCHSKDSLFLSLVNAGVSFPKMDTLIFGYQDPFQSRLNQPDIAMLDLLECYDPVCLLTDQGLAATLRCCPRLSSLHIRHAPYLERPSTWDPALWATRPASERDGGAPPRPPPPAIVGLRSLTLENCPGIHLENLEDLVNKSSLMPHLDTLVLRDMFPVLPKDCHLSSTWPTLDHVFAMAPFRDMEAAVPAGGLNDDENPVPMAAGIQAFWQSVVRALRVADRMGPGVARGGQQHNLQPPPPPPLREHHDFLRPNDVNAAVRTFRYCMQLYQLGFGGVVLRNPDLFLRVDRNQLLTTSSPITAASSPSTGRRSSRRHSNTSTSSSSGSATSHCNRRRSNSSLETSPADFFSRGTQTCLCGLLEWQHFQVLKQQQTSNSQTEAGSSSSTPVSTTSFTWQQQPSTSPSNSGSSPTKTTAKLFHATQVPCLICSAGDSKPHISSEQPEANLRHAPRVWAARDATVDTASLRLHLAPAKHTFTLDASQQLTTLHLENVGLTHVLIGQGGAPRLKNLTMENCPELQSLVVQSTSAKQPGLLLPSLRRVCIVRCPKFAIYHFLYTMTSLFPQHDDNLYITFRPFGEYNSLVEKVLWQNSKSCHVLVSHDYKQKASEREMEELRSSFDQLFREVLNFSETLIRREILTVHETPDVNTYSNGNFMRSEHANDWDMTTDIPWISEVCCSMLPNDLSRAEQADQLYELLAEIQTSSHQMKLRRRGIHYHVQCRDIHPTSYLPRPYTDSMLSSMHPLSDLNAFYTATPISHPAAPSPPSWMASVPTQTLRLDDDSDTDKSDDEMEEGLEGSAAVVEPTDDAMTSIADQWDPTDEVDSRVGNSGVGQGAGANGEDAKSSASTESSSSTSSSDCSPFLRCEEAPDDLMLEAEDEAEIAPLLIDP